ncbi:MAG: hypothetical protein IPM51_00690 [Sphingobacteriaceae bacterium]|nr:hypothetical protein [Sphingobacteriaceae bacterium]
MKNLILPLLFIPFSLSIAQNATVVKNGMILTMSHKDFGLSHVPEITNKTKTAEREKLVDEFNEKALSGQMKFFSKDPVTIEIANEKSSDKGTSFITYYRQPVVGGSGCRSVNKFDGALFFTKDTTYWAVHTEPMMIQGITKDYKVDTTAILTFPILRYPSKIKIGDVLPISMMHYMVTPQKSFSQVMAAVVTGKKTTKSIENVEVQKFGIGNSNYGFEQRLGIVTRYENVYEYVPVELETNIEMGLSRIFNVGAAVTATENISISGKTYLAYIIRSEEWNGDLNVKMDAKAYTDKKSEVSNTVASKAEQLALRRQLKAAKKVEKAMNKGADNKNEEGYTVMYEDRWYVPELGLEVKKIRYNKYGIIEYILEPLSITYK